jgi:hypothetical protein
MKLKVSVPIVKENSPDSWEKYKVDGTLEIEIDGSEFEAQVNTLLKRVDAQFLLIEDTKKIDEKIRMAEGKLADVQADLKLAHAQLNRVGQFLKGIGVNPQEHLLRVDENLKLRSAEVKPTNGDREAEDEEEDD